MEKSLAMSINNKVFQCLIACLLVLSCPVLWAKPAVKNAYQFSFNTAKGGVLKLSDYKGKVILIVNTASKCVFTPQFAGLEKLYQQYKDKGLVVIGIPSNDFGNQDPGANEEIVNFCQKNYGVTFPMTTKEKVTGENAAPFFQWVIESLGSNASPKWNFYKYLINKQGGLVIYYSSVVKPDATELQHQIEALLNSK